MATTIEVFEPMVLTGLLQTEAYARELIDYHASITVGVDVERSLALRMQRQSVLTRKESPAELWCVAEEQVLRRPINSPAVMAEQLEHLLEMTTRPNINLQIIPHTVGIHPALQGAFSLFRFEDDWRVAFEETRRSAYYYDKPDAVEDYGKVMNHLRNLALDSKKSRSLIARVRKELLRSTTGGRPPSAPTTRRASRLAGPRAWSVTATASTPMGPPSSSPRMRRARSS
jgi:hypothetical protein